MAQDYGKTLNLPKTDFPMRAGLPKREPETLKNWEQSELYKEMLKKNKGKPSFILHDGPPYANGDIHIGHALNKLLKDIIIKQKSMSGYYAPYVPGWDTHGLPIERQAIKKLGINRNEVTPTEFRKVCHDFAIKYVTSASNLSVWVYSVTGITPISHLSRNMRQSRLKFSAKWRIKDIFTKA